MTENHDKCTKRFKSHNTDLFFYKTAGGEKKLKNMC